MALLNKKKRAHFGAAIDSTPAVKAQAGGASQVGSLFTYAVGAGVQTALTVPTISRARDLIVSMVGSLMLRQYQNPTGPGQPMTELPLEGWMSRPDPNVTPGFIMSRTASDLFMVGRAFWYISSRYATGFPASFKWMPAANVTTSDQAGPFWFGQSDEIYFNGFQMQTADVVQFISPIDGILATGQRAIDIAIRLDQSARRFATNEIAAGFLQQVDGSEPMSGEELSELASAWATSRRTNAIGALNQYVKFVEFNADPSKLQLAEGREHAARELARVANIPPYLVGVDTGGMTYQNAQQARQDLFLFGAKPYIQCIEQTLSMPNVIARGRHVEFDVETYIQSWNMDQPEQQEVTE